MNTEKVVNEDLGVLGTIILYEGTLTETAKKRLDGCNKSDLPVFGINMNLFRRNRRTVWRHFIRWSLNHQIAKLSFCSQKRTVCRKPSGRSFWLKAAIRDCYRNLAMVQEMPNLM